MAQNERLGQLTDAQKDQVREWVEEGKSPRKIAEEMARPEPEGFGIKVSHMTVERFRDDLKKQKMREELGEQEAMAVELLELASKGAVDYRQATVQILQRKVFSAAADAKGDAACEMLRKLVEMEQRQQRIELAEKNHGLSKQRFEFNTAREVMKKAGAYLEIFRHPTMDNEEKVWEARKLCFGAVEKEGERIALTEGNKGNEEGKVSEGSVSSEQ